MTIKFNQKHDFGFLKIKTKTSYKNEFCSRQRAYSKIMSIKGISEN